MTAYDGSRVEHEHDLAGNRTRLTVRDAGGTITSQVGFTHDHRNRLARVEEQTPGEASTTWAYARDALGRLTALTRHPCGNGPLHCSADLEVSYSYELDTDHFDVIFERTKQVSSCMRWCMRPVS